MAPSVATAFLAALARRDRTDDPGRRAALEIAGSGLDSGSVLVYANLDSGGCERSASKLAVALKYAGQPASRPATDSSEREVEALMSSSAT
jgi:hypothetical protein